MQQLFFTLTALSIILTLFLIGMYFQNFFTVLKIRLKMIYRVIFRKKVVLFSFKKDKVENSMIAKQLYDGVSFEKSKSFVNQFYNSTLRTIQDRKQEEINLKFIKEILKK